MVRSDKKRAIGQEGCRSKGDFSSGQWRETKEARVEVSLNPSGVRAIGSSGSDEE
jgi:hypothetical protein